MNVTDYDDEPVPCPAPSTVRKCSRVQWFAGMSLAIKGVPENNEGKGLSVSRGWFDNDTRGAIKRWVTYHAKARDQGLVVNFCPWCGNEIRWDK